MGNWRTVQLKGKMANWKEINNAIEYLTVNKTTYDSRAYEEDDVFYLQFGSGVFSINQWINDNGEIDSTGNVYERDCSIDDLEKELKVIAAKFPSLVMELHAGGDYEDLSCECSFIVQDGYIERLSPMVSTLDKIDSSRAMSNLMKQLRGQ